MLERHPFFEQSFSFRDFELLEEDW